MMSKSITIRMVAATIFLVALVTITFSLLFLFQLEHALVEDFDRQSTSLTENLALNAELGLLLEDEETLTALGNNLLTEESITEIRFLDRDNQVLVALEKPQSSKDYLVAFSSPVRLTRQVSEFDLFVEPVFRNGERYELGTVEVVFSQARLQHLIKELQHRIYFFACIGLIAGGILAYYLSWVTLKPVKRLAQASREIAGGNWEMRVQESGNDEIGQLTRDFNAMTESLVKKRQELQESYQELARQERLAEIGRFSTIVAHEIKNPLGIIKGALNILAKPGGSLNTKETMLCYIDEEVTRLNHLAEEFLDFARPPTPKKERVELWEIVNKAKALTEARENKGKEVTVTIPAPSTSAPILGDKNLIFQALLNLIENSIDACAEQVIIAISLHTNDEGTSLTLSDNGSGISKEDREQIFEPFFTRKEKGTGLGLSIVKKIVEMHQGRIVCEERHTEGACFTVWLPKAPDPE